MEQFQSINSISINSNESPTPLQGDVNPSDMKQN